MRRSTALSAAVLGFLFVLPARTSCGEKPDQKQILALLSSSDWQERERAIRALQPLPPPQLSPEIREKLVGLLQAETDLLWGRAEGRIPKPKHPGLTDEQYEGGAGEAQAEYYAKLLGLVLNLHDIRALPVMVSTAAQPSDVDLRLAHYGAAVIPIVRSRLEYLRRGLGTRPSDPLMFYLSESAMAEILTEVVKLDKEKKLRPPLGPSDYSSVIKALRPLIDSHNGDVRLYAARGLIQAGDTRDVAPIRNTLLDLLHSPIPGIRRQALEWIAANLDNADYVPMAKVRELASSDPAHYRQGVLGKGPVVYPVREAARVVLRKFGNESDQTKQKNYPAAPRSHS
jgi:hypothetical protein